MLALKAALLFRASCGGWVGGAVVIPAGAVAGVVTAAVAVYAVATVAECGHVCPLRAALLFHATCMERYCVGVGYVGHSLWGSFAVIPLCVPQEMVDGGGGRHEWCRSATPVGAGQVARVGVG